MWYTICTKCHQLPPILVHACHSSLHFFVLGLAFIKKCSKWLCTTAGPRCGGVQPFGVSGPHWKKSCLGTHIKYTNTNENWWAKKKKVFSKFKLLCWATFIAILGCTGRMGCRLDTPGLELKKPGGFYFSSLGSLPPCVKLGLLIE